MISALIVAWVAVFFLAVASVADLRIGEIPEGISVGFIVFVLSVAVADSTIEGNTRPLVSTALLGFIFFAFAYVIYRLGQWGGGDVKLMGGIGAALGFMDAAGFIWPNARIMPYPLSFIVGMGFLALPYALVYSTYLTARHPEVLSEFKSYLKKPSMKAMTACSFIPAALTYLMKYETLALIYLLIPAVFFSITYLKAVEEKTLKKRIQVNELREGDVLSEDVVYGSVCIRPEHAIEGLSEAQVEEVKRLFSEGKIPAQVSIKWGIKFAPILLLSFAITVWVGNLLEMLLFSVIV